MGLDGTELWRQIPPEEKLELMARAQAKGVFAVFITILVSSTIAVGLQITWLIWGSVLSAPLVFQFAAGKAWRFLRPKVMLEYLAARSVARRYAFANNSKDLNLTLIFKGNIEEQFEDEQGQEALEATIANNKESEVWVALFGDAVIMLVESPGGAKLRFAHVLDDKLAVESYSPDGEDYSSHKEVTLAYPDKIRGDKKVKLTSRYPAALVVFEKRLLELQAEFGRQRQIEAQQASITRARPFEKEDDDMMRF